VTVERRSGGVEPFAIRVADADLADLHDRLDATRWPDAAPVDDWSQGVPLPYLRDLVEHWRHRYDWRATEARLSALPQVRVDVDGLGIHAVHARSPHPGALPLVLTHGWPGAFLEFEQVVGPLTHPEAYGGDPADAFHVVCPSLPGYGFSDRPTVAGWGIERIAAAWDTLMGRLGYPRYGAAGSDWGTSVSTLLALHAPDRVAGIHLVPPLAAPDPATLDDLTAAERAALDDLAEAERWESGYAALQATRPQTVGYGLDDSPVGLCAWIVEKLRAWSDNDGLPESAIPRDRMLDLVTLYWLTATATSSARLYRESFATVQAWFTDAVPDVVDVPTGCSIFPKEMPRPSRRWAARRFPDIRHWHELDRGGHFAALEQPALFVDELRSFFRLVR
jgi:pimeloyl-ACP methyl ester carboxylesterase